MRFPDKDAIAGQASDAPDDRRLSLIRPDKFQTGYDEPLLHTMYVNTVPGITCDD